MKSFDIIKQNEALLNVFSFVAFFARPVTLDHLRKRFKGTEHLGQIVMDLHKLGAFYRAGDKYHVSFIGLEFYNLYVKPELEETLQKEMSKRSGEASESGPLNKDIQKKP